MNIDTGVIRELRPHISGVDEVAELKAMLAEREMLLAEKGPLSEKALRGKAPLDRLRILRAEEKRARRRTRNLRGFGR